VLASYRLLAVGKHLNKGSQLNCLGRLQFAWIEEKASRKGKDVYYLWDLFNDAFGIETIEYRMIG
jgi:hypothetical protein